MKGTSIDFSNLCFFFGEKIRNSSISIEQDRERAKFFAFSVDISPELIISFFSPILSFYLYFDYEFLKNSKILSLSSIT